MSARRRSTPAMPWASSWSTISRAGSTAVSLSPPSRRRRGRRRRADSRLFHETAAELVLDVDLDDLLEGFLGLEAQRRCAGGVEIPRPPLDDLHDPLIRRAPDAFDDIVARHLAEGLDLLADGHRQPRHRQVASRPDGCAVDGCGVDQKIDRRTRTGMPV